jgi:hypothetical protein
LTTKNDALMATLLHHNAVFLHVPKTGGTFLRRLFEALDLVRFNFARDHADMERTLHVSRHYPGNFLRCSLRLGENLDRRVGRCYKFCFVRNPFDWYESCWRFLVAQPRLLLESSRTRFGFKQDPWQPWAEIMPLMRPDFNAFVAEVIRQRPGYVTQLFERYADPQHIDFVGRQEYLQEDILLVFKHLGVECDPAVFQKPGRVNESQPRPLQWDADHRDLIYALEAPAFRRYGY